MQQTNPNSAFSQGQGFSQTVFQAQQKKQSINPVLVFNPIKSDQRLKKSCVFQNEAILSKNSNQNIYSKQQNTNRQQLSKGEIQQCSKQNQRIYFPQKHNKLVVLIGLIGSGKTTLFNAVCNAKQPIAAGGQSVTQCIFSKNSAYGNGFRILDTPGLGIQSKKIAHACAIRCALSEDPVDQIIIVIKAERTDLMQKNLKPMVSTLSRFKDITTVVVTHWDYIKQDQAKESVEKIQKEIIKMISNFNINSVIFSEQIHGNKKIIDSNGSMIWEVIDKILMKSSAKNTQLTETEFYANFDLIELTDQVEVQLNKAKEQVTVEFRKRSKVIKKFIQDFDIEHIYLADVMHALTIQIKFWAIEIIDKFEKDNQDQFSKLLDDLNDISLSFLVHVELKKELMVEVNSLIQSAQQKMTVKKDHCFNFIKRCPFCGIIWLKVSGCEGETSCGNFPTVDENFKNVPQHKRFHFFFKEGELQYCDFGTIQFKGKYYKDPGQQLRFGCGGRFTWSEIDPLDPCLVKELLDVGILDYMAKEVEYKEQKLKLKYNLQNQVNKEAKMIQIQYI